MGSAAAHSQNGHLPTTWRLSICSYLHTIFLFLDMILKMYQNSWTVLNWTDSLALNPRIIQSFRLEKIFKIIKSNPMSDREFQQHQVRNLTQVSQLLMQKQILEHPAFQLFGPLQLFFLEITSKSEFKTN